MMTLFKDDFIDEGNLVGILGGNNMKYEELKNGIIGIYKIDFPNGKTYIGLSNNIKRRIREHWTDERRLKMVCHFALKKYYSCLQEIEVEILEQFSFLDYKILSEREKYWISFYSSNDKKCGYNITEGGTSLTAFSSPHCKFKSEDIDEIYEMLLDGHSNKNIAKKFNVCPDTIGRINNGWSYKKEGYAFPLRKPREMKDYRGFNNPNALSSEKVNEIMSLLESSSLTYEEIAKKENVSFKVVFQINKGETYKKEGKTYPIRVRIGNRNHPLTKEKVKQIKEELKKSSRSLKELAEYYQCSYDAIVSLNDGKTFYDKNQEYPIRISKLHPKKPVSTIAESGE